MFSWLATRAERQGLNLNGQVPTRTWRGDEEFRFAGACRPLAQFWLALRAVATARLAEPRCWSDKHIQSSLNFCFTAVAAFGCVFDNQQQKGVR